MISTCKDSEAGRKRKTSQVTKTVDFMYTQRTEPQKVASIIRLLEYRYARNQIKRHVQNRKR